MKHAYSIKIPGLPVWRASDSLAAFLLFHEALDRVAKAGQRVKLLEDGVLIDSKVR